MGTNGEAWILHRLKDGGIQVRCAFDVGANVGDWISLCRQYHPHCTIHAFEIAIPTLVKLHQNFGTLPQVILNPFGLSNCNKELDFYLPEAEGESGRTTAYKDHLEPAFEAPGHEATSARKMCAHVISGDEYLKKQKIEMIDILKIDVEGMEEVVLKGLAKALTEHRVRIIQFEYNTTNIVSKFLLHEAYKFFTNLGYRIGKLYPNYVEFRNYHYRQEDFCGPNFVAVRNDDIEILKLLGS